MFFRIQPGLPQKCWSHQLPRGVLRPKTDPRSKGAPVSAIQSVFFPIFCPSKVRSKTWTAQKLLLRKVFPIFGRPGVDLQRFWVPKKVPGAYFFSIFFLTVILFKLCSR